MTTILTQGEAAHGSLTLPKERMTDIQTMYPDFSALTVKKLLAITLRKSCSKLSFMQAQIQGNGYILMFSSSPEFISSSKR
jgi:hypothetical protein